MSYGWVEYGVAMTGGHVMLAATSETASRTAQFLGDPSRAVRRTVTCQPHRYGDATYESSEWGPL